MVGALPSGIEISKGINEQDPLSIFEVENTSENSQNTFSSCSMKEGVQPESYKSNAICRRCVGSRAQTHVNEERWSALYCSISAGEGDVTTEEASPAPGELVTAETCQSAICHGGVPQRGWRVARNLS